MIEYKCLSYNKDYINRLDKKLKNKFKNAFKFSNNVSINLFVVKERCLSLLVYGWLQKSNEMTLPKKEEFYSTLNME